MPMSFLVSLSVLPSPVVIAAAPAAAAAAPRRCRRRHCVGNPSPYPSPCVVYLDISRETVIKRTRDIQKWSKMAIYSLHR